MLEKISYYATGHTAEGFVNFLESNLEEIETKIIIKSPSNYWETEVLRGLLEVFEDAARIEVIHSPVGKAYLKGIIIRERSIAILASTHFQTEIEDAVVWDLTDYLAKPFEENLQLEKILKGIQRSERAAYDVFANGLKIHDDLEAVYIKNMNFERADALASKLVDELLGDVPKRGRTPKVYHRLFGTNTPEGVVNVVPELLKGADRCDFIKGRAGTGKSTFMRKVADACLKKGYDIELYHCSFAPGSIDMVFVRDLKYCIFDSTDPHEFSPSKQGDAIIDTYAEFVEPGTDELYADEIEFLNNAYKTEMKQGIVYLQEVGVMIDKLEAYYQTFNFQAEKIIADIKNSLV